jgi:hypothetical protein
MLPLLLATLIAWPAGVRSREQTNLPDVDVSIPPAAGPGDTPDAVRCFNLSEWNGPPITMQRGGLSTGCTPTEETLSEGPAPGPTDTNLAPLSVPAAAPVDVPAESPVAVSATPPTEAPAAATSPVSINAGAAPLNAAPVDSPTTASPGASSTGAAPPLPAPPPAAKSQAARGVWLSPVLMGALLPGWLALLS